LDGDPRGGPEAVGPIVTPGRISYCGDPGRQEDNRLVPDRDRSGWSGGRLAGPAPGASDGGRGMDAALEALKGELA
jgi:hypothetical protein